MSVVRHASKLLPALLLGFTVALAHAQTTQSSGMSQKAAPTSAGAPGAGGAPEGLVIKTKSSPMAQQETPKIEERRAPEPATPMSVAMGKNALAPVTLNCRPGPLPANIGCPGSWVDLDPTPKTCWACIIHKPEPME